MKKYLIIPVVLAIALVLVIRFTGYAKADAKNEVSLGDAKTSLSTEKVTLDAPITKSDLKILDKRVSFTFMRGELELSSVVYTIEGIGDVVFLQPEAGQILSFSENTAIRDTKINAYINK